MLEYIAEEIAIWVAAVSTFYLLAGSLLWLGMLIAARRRPERQWSRLNEEIGAVSGDSLTVNWMRYKELGKGQIINASNARGWEYVDQDIRDDGWILRFFRKSPYAIGQQGSAIDERRLVEDLHNASINEQGYYEVDERDYMGLERETIANIVETNGWNVSRRLPCGQKGSQCRFLLTRVEAKPGSYPG